MKAKQRLAKHGTTLPLIEIKIKYSLDKTEIKILMFDSCYSLKYLDFLCNSLHKRSSVSDYTLFCVNYGGNQLAMVYLSRPPWTGNLMLSKTTCFPDSIICDRYFGFCFILCPKIIITRIGLVVSHRRMKPYLYRYFWSSCSNATLLSGEYSKFKTQRSYKLNKRPMGQNARGQHSSLANVHGPQRPPMPS